MTDDELDDELETIRLENQKLSDELDKGLGEMEKED